MSQPSLLLSLGASDYKLNNVIKALTAYSKFIGQYEIFRSKLRSCGIHYKKQYALQSFLNILDTESHNDLDVWYEKAQSILRPNEQLFLRFVALSGLRREESTIAFNLLTASTPNYYNPQTGFLEHFKIKNNGKHIFLRGSKNAFISAVPLHLIAEIHHSQPVNYNRITKRLKQHGLASRFQELRSFYATQLRQLGLLQEQVDIMQGRISGTIFLQYYFKQNPKTLSHRILALLSEYESKLKPQITVIAQ